LLTIIREPSYHREHIVNINEKMGVSFSCLREIMNRESCYRILLFIVRQVEKKLLITDYLEK